MSDPQVEGPGRQGPMHLLCDGCTQGWGWGGVGLLSRHPAVPGKPARSPASLRRLFNKD